MKLFKKDPPPQLDIETAREILQHTFEVTQNEPNSVPLEVLASYSNYRKERFTLQKTVLVLLTVFFLLIPFLFIPPSFTLSAKTDEYGANPVYRLELESLMLVDQLTVRIGDLNIPAYEVDSHVYSIEPPVNGQMVITVKLINRQTYTEYIEVTNVDKDAPVIESYEVIDHLLHLFVSDGGVGVDFGGIVALNSDGQEVVPLETDASSGEVIFEHPSQIVNITFPDKVGNVLQVMLVTE